MPNIQPQVTGQRNGLTRSKSCDVSEILGLRISLRLAVMGKTQGWLADKLDVSNAAVSKWTTGKSSPTYLNLKKMAHYLDCPVGYLAEPDTCTATEEILSLLSLTDERGKALALSAVRAVLEAYS
jgi:transcriptional regulator with XRE-family HTH domain